MLKPTKRKAFNFLRSYYDVYNELANDVDKLAFIDAILNKQFLNEDPINLNFIANLCYKSQMHALDSSVKGWIRVNKTDLIGNKIITIPTNPTIDPPTNPTTNPEEEKEEVEVEEEEEGKGKVKVVKSVLNKTFDVDWDNLIIYFNKVTSKNIRVVNAKTKRQILQRLKDGYSKNDLMNAISNCFKDKYHIESGHSYLTLEFISRPDKMERFSQSQKKVNVFKPNDRL